MIFTSQSRQRARQPSGRAGARHIIILLLVALAAQATAEPRERILTLQAAVQLAREADEPSLLRHAARAEALSQLAVADAQLPDPQLSSGLANVPVDSPALDGADMTQITLGLRQEFPAGDTLALRGQQREAQAQEQQASRRAEYRNITLDTRRAWLHLFYHHQAEAILEESIRAVVELLDSLSARFATGRLHAQDMLRTELELDLLRDQLSAHQQEAAGYRARLARRIGAAAQGRLPDTPPELSEPEQADIAERRLTEHPLVQALDARIAASRSGVELAEAAYRPSFSLQAGYGIRTERSDFASIGVGVSMPLFTDKRQDRRRLAALHSESADRLHRQALLLDLRRQLQQGLSDWEHLSRRVALYRNAVAERARQTAEASISTYGSGQTDFAELIRAQLAQLQVQLTELELLRDRGLARSDLAYLTGDSP